MGRQTDLNALYDIYLVYYRARVLALAVVNQANRYPHLGDIYGPEFVNGKLVWPMAVCTENSQGQPPFQAFLKLATISGQKVEAFTAELLNYSDADGDLEYADLFIMWAWRWAGNDGLGDKGPLSREQWKHGWVGIMACIPMETERGDDECLYDRFCRLVRELDGLIFMQDYIEVWKDGENTILERA
ncbi:hypothetical protein MAJ_11424, partial [Metarhizium majus ARSEF 297]